LEICADAKCIHSPLDSLKGVLDEYNHTQVLLSSKKLDSYHMPLPGVCIMKTLDDDMNFNSSFKDHIISTNGNGVKAWKSIFSKPSWRTNTDYLSKVSRYTDEGLEIVEEGGELVVKQADGVVVGKLDPNDVYDPGQMKVLGESSGRHFDPDVAGGPIVKKSWSNPTINQSGIDDVSTHVARFTDPEAIANNNFMINRLDAIKNGQRVPDDFDKRFYTHELEEYSRFENLGVGSGPHTEANYLNSHTASLEAYSINENITKIYPPEVPFPQYAGY